MIKIKVCGMRDKKNVEQISMLPIHFMGFIFYEKSPRFVDETTINFLANWHYSNIQKVGIFVNEKPEKIIQIVQKYHLDFVQLHGKETPEICQYLYQQKIKTIKAFSVQQAQDLFSLSQYESCVSYFLFDTKTNLHGGSGKQFDWSILQNYKGNIPFFLSGGIDTESVFALSKFNHPQWQGIDLNSCFENFPGEKNFLLLNQFLQQIKTQNI